MLWKKTLRMVRPEGARALRAGRLSLTTHHLLLATLIVLLVLFPFLHTWPVLGQIVGGYRIYNATMFGIWLLITLSMNLLTGYSGQISLGHAAVVLIGAYTTAIIHQQAAVGLPIAILLAALSTGFMGGVLIGIPAVRLGGPYLAIATFALAMTLPQVLKIRLLTPWTNGARGLRLPAWQTPPFLPSLLDTSQWRYYTVLVVVALLTWLFWNLTRSRYGRAFVALRDHEIGATQLGVNVALYKAMAFGLSAFYAGLGGGLFFYVQGFVSPESLGLFDSILLLVAIVIGGLGSLLGSLFGALFLTLQTEFIAALTAWIPQAEHLGGVLFGCLLILAPILFPQGLAGFIHQQWQRKENKRTGSHNIRGAS